MEPPDQRTALLILNMLDSIGPVTIRRLREAIAPDEPEFARAILAAPLEQLLPVKGVRREMAESIVNWRGTVPWEREIKLLEKHAARFLTAEDAEYPDLLREIYDPPSGLYCLGEIPRQPMVAIVGTRRPTLYGRTVARDLAGGLARRGICVVSGMARGIDTEAHQAALLAGGKTVAVLGNGVDIVYPSENLELYRKISQSGAVLSEFALGRTADRQSFPQRNRIVSGMSQVVLVVETDDSGGSMITAKFAGEQGRTVMAVPGRIDQPAARGCHQLIRDGAILVRGLEDVLEEVRGGGQTEMDFTGAVPAAKDGKKQELSETEKELWQLFSDGRDWHPEELAERTGWSIAQVSSQLMFLELKRCIARRIDGRYERR